MTSRKDLRRYGAAALALAWALGWLAGGTPSEARHDPLRIIFTQAKEKPNIYIVLDESGSLHWWPDYDHSCRPVRPPGASSDITLVVDGDFTVTNPYCGGSSPGCTGHGYWALARQDASFSYWYFVPPSRAAMIKNFFGNCVTIWELKKEWADNVPSCPATPVCQGVDSRGVRYFRFPRNGGPTGGAYLDKTTGGSGTWRNYTCNSSTTQEPPGDPNYTRPRPPYRFVERNKDLAFWGLARFTTAVGGNASRVTPGLPTDNNSNQSAVTAINNEMGTDQPRGACSGNNGFSPGGGTPTQRGLNFAKGEIAQWFGQDSAGQFCRRPYYVILLTDGQSNTCNPSNGAQWGNSCTGWNNSGSSLYWTRMPPGRADDLFLQKAPPVWTECWNNSPPPGEKSPLPVQTFAVGISPAVSPCELNLVAYMGRTDSSREDAGVRWQDNTDRAPQNTTDPTTLANYWAAPRPECSACPPGTRPDPNRNNPNCQAKCGDYAFFANNPDELQNAFNKILAGILAGDYSMGTSTSVGGDVTATLGSVLVPSTQIPTWRGSLRHWETVPCNTPPPPGTSFVNVSTIKFNELCQKLEDPTITIISGIPTCGGANPQNLPYFRLRWDAACSLLKQADPAQNDYKRAIYTVSSACGRANPATGPSPECQNPKKLVKGDASLRDWLRTNVTTVNWSSLDLNGNGTPASTDNGDIDMLIDFILGGDGSGTKRAWLLGDLVGSSPVIVAHPDSYISGTVPPKTVFDALVQNRPPMAYVTANDGLLHAFELKHDPRDPSSPPIERFAFLPPQAFPAVVQLFLNYRSYVQQGKNIPTGQAEVPNFDEHIWTMSAPLNTADVWVRWWPDPAVKWRTLLLVPMGPKIPGLYALDVSHPAQDPSRPFSVWWYWDGAEARAQACSTCDKVWSGVPIAPSLQGGKVIDGSFYQNWMVGVVTTDSADTHVKSYLTALAADTGQLDPFNRQWVWPSALPTCDPNGNQFCIPFHVYGNAAMQSADVDINRPDTLATHGWFADTLGKVPMLWLADQDAALWRYNAPSPIVDMGSTQPIYFTPALAHALGRKAMLMATATGSILETDGDVNDKNKTFCGSGQFCTLVQLDLFKVADTKDLQVDTSLPLAKRQARLQMANVTVKLDADCDADGVDDDGDGDKDECDGNPMIDRTLSKHTRVTARPLITVESFRKTGGNKARVYFLLYDPMVFNADAGACTGESFLFPIEVEFEQTGAGGSVGFTTPSTSWTWGQQLKPLRSLGLTPVMGITAVAGRLVIVRTGYGEAIAAPYLPGDRGPSPPPPMPQLRGVKRIQ